MLKELNRLDEALTAYDEVVAEHPESIYARSGRAEVLKELNRLDEALAAYDETIAEYPWNLVARNGRAEVLKALNRLDEALGAYDKIIAESPWDVVTKNGYAYLLAALHRWNEALAQLPDKSPVTVAEWIGFHIRGMVLLQRGEVQNAIEIFEEVVRMTPRATTRDYFRTALVIARLHREEYEHAYLALQSIDTHMLQIPTNILRLHVAGRMGDDERATRAKESLPSVPWPVMEDLQNELQRRYIEQEPPEHSDEWLITSEIRCLLLAA